MILKQFLVGMLPWELCRVCRREVVSAAPKLKAIAQTPASLWKMTCQLRMSAALCTSNLDAGERIM